MPGISPGTTSQTTEKTLEVSELAFGYGVNTLLRIDRFELDPGESVAVIGPSGCGKTTFMHLIAGLLTPVRGTVRVCGESLGALSDSQRDRFRGEHMGIVFQRFHLLPALSVMDNVLLAQRLARKPPDRGAVRALLEQLGISDVERQKPSMLSQGQAQRVAIARALVHRPVLLMADEPTSALDDHNAGIALKLLREAARSARAALLVVTHDERVRGHLDREFELGAPT